MYRTQRELKEEVTRKLIVLVILLAALLSLGTLVYHLSEGWSLIDSLYFSAISLTSRGFSDLRPTRWYSVLFSVFYLLIGVAFVIYALSSLISYYISYYEEHVTRLVGRIKKKKRRSDKWYMISPKKNG